MIEGLAKKFGFKDELYEKYNREKLLEKKCFDDTNYIILQTIFLEHIIKIDHTLDAGFERFELECYLADKVTGFDEMYSPLFDLLFEFQFTISIKTLDEFLFHLKLCIIYEHIENESSGDESSGDEFSLF